MGYDLHITRADDWAQNRGREISPEEWQEIVAADPELRFAGYNGPHFVIWEADPEDDESWLDLVEGNITTKNPDPPLLRKMIEIAGRLHARVQGDDGEFYDMNSPEAADEAAPPDSRWPMLTFLLSLVPPLALAIAIPIDSAVREAHPTPPMPLKWILVLVGLVAVGVGTWFVSIALAILCLISPTSKRQFAWAALIICGISAALSIALAK